MHLQAAPGLRHVADQARATTWITAVHASWERWALGAILLLAAFLNLYRLDREGYTNS